MSNISIENNECLEVYCNIKLHESNKELKTVKDSDSGRGVSLHKELSNSSHSLSSSSSSSSSSLHLKAKSIPTPPDGGWGWMVVFASFMVNLIADGVSLSFGILYIHLVSYFDESKAKTAWVGSLFLSMPLLMGPIASALTDRYGCRKVAIAGSLLATSGFAMSFFSNSLEFLFLTFSISGFGLALCYVTSIVIVAYYFEKKRALATGLAVCGTGIGTFVFAPLTIVLLEKYEWRGTLLILSGFFLNIVVFGSLMRDLEISPKELEVSDFESETESKRYSEDGRDSYDETDKVDGISRDRLCNSLVQLPTYISSENVPVEVINELSTKEKGHLSTLLDQFPDILNSFVSDFVPGEAPRRMSPNKIQTVDTIVKISIGDLQQKPVVIQKENIKEKHEHKQNHILRHQTQRHVSWWGQNILERTDSALLNNLRLQRGSLTYRGAMLNIHRYRLRASSCPDIYRNSMTTLDRREQACAFFQDLKDFLVDMVDLTIFRSIHYTLFCLSNFLLYACVDIPYVYLPDNAITHDVEEESASFLISILGILNMVGVVMVGYGGDKKWIDSSFLYSAFISVSGLTIAVIPWVKTYAGLASIAGIYGFTISANYALVSVIIVDIISLDKFTNAYGLLLLIQGFASIIGPPLAGYMFDSTGNYDATFYVTGTTIFVSGVMVVPVSKSFKFSLLSALLFSPKSSCEMNRRVDHVRFQFEKENEESLEVKFCKKPSVSDGQVVSSLKQKKHDEVK
ncbi:uncharacterized protein LOC106459835 [Limulus polyphemus]|uniref:Uncharacterized protein LOC106459835 n=1 Tax=Limulus polyphemus TaxID=6850 RepID=A0ABM1SEP1_LIMPO|nr:uncharacterized protein LOC106459835 [Limulus polyphemus]XP_022242095.1 uncharacterized protein LOC106459835 [Limulus polyphemus]XP_022242096.1 uncharacterized protein LOC106459835 [Limulus polyphemus]